jgi:sarcosine oxidase subunit alpha
MKQLYRLPSGGRIDRTAPLTFRFDGRRIEGYVGDTLASALLANGVHLVGRSFKYHRPRGILAHGSEEPNALLEIDRGAGRIDPNNRATQVEATDGLSARSQNCWPTLRYDFAALNDLLSPLLAAGFYYKTFMWPRAFWDAIYEPRIRAAAGLGKAPGAADADRYVHRHAHCEVLIVGAGPAGLAAACAAARSGLRVIVADEQAELGGTLLHEPASTTIGRIPAQEWLALTIETLRKLENVTLLPRTTAFGYYNHNHVALVERITDHLRDPPRALPRERLWQVRARAVVLATGAHERPLLFADNDRPGIMLAESVRHYINRYAVKPGQRIVFATNGASAYQAAADAHAAGIDVTVVDVRPESECQPAASELRAQGVPVHTGRAIVGSVGRQRVAGLVVSAAGTNGTTERQTVACDCVAMSGGWTPAVHLFSQSRGKLRFEQSLDAFVPHESVQSERSAGACRGTYDLAACLDEGWSAGLAVSHGTPARSFAVSPATATGFSAAANLRGARNEAHKRVFVDFQNDVTVGDIELAVREGFESVEHLKRYTTTGMATDQGRTSNMTALSLLAQLRARPVQEVGTTTYRPPYTPVSFGALVGSARGSLFEPARRTPIHEWAAARGAKFENVGLWQRAWYFPRPGEDMRAAVRRECRAVRTAVGIFDASTLGKIEVVGPDAAEFMNRMYINGWSRLEPGRCRYGVMLKEDGYIFDDGVVARMSSDTFHVTTATGTAPRVLAHMEDYLQTEWPDLRVFVTSITEQWAVIAVQGPQARRVLAPLVDIDLSSPAFPHMCVRTGCLSGVPVRLFRVSFTGELGFEINVPSDYARAVWDLVHASGERYGITPYGTETMHVLRAERGFIIVGQETDGTVTPHDVGLESMIGKTKTDFVGKRSLQRLDMLDPKRKQLAGLRTATSDLILEEGAQVVELDPKGSGSMKILGHVTSSYWSETCGRSIALALLEAGRALHGRTVHVTTPTGFTTAAVTEPVFVASNTEHEDE